MTEQIIIFFQIVFIDLVLAGDNAIVIGMVASQFPIEQRKKENYILGNWRCCNFKNYFYFNNCLFTSNYRVKINRWNIATLYMLQIIHRYCKK